MNFAFEIIATLVDVLFFLWFIPRFNHCSVKQKPITCLWVVGLLVFQLVADYFLQGFQLLYMLGAFLIALGFAASFKRNFVLMPIFSALLFVIEPMLFNSLIFAVFSIFIDNLDHVMQGALTYSRIIYIII